MNGAKKDDFIIYYLEISKNIFICYNEFRSGFMKIELKKGSYFSYVSEERQRKIYDLFEKGLIPSYGSNSSWAKDGKEYFSHI